ncbi:unnamed protein product [Ectocarpus sp. 6 AP-2014]
MTTDAGDELSPQVAQYVTGHHARAFDPAVSTFYDKLKATVAADSDTKWVHLPHAREFSPHLRGAVQQALTAYPASGPHKEKALSLSANFAEHGRKQRKNEKDLVRKRAELKVRCVVLLLLVYLCYFGWCVWAVRYATAVYIRVLLWLVRLRGALCYCCLCACATFVRALGRLRCATAVYVPVLLFLVRLVRLRWCFCWCVCAALFVYLCYFCSCAWAVRCATAVYVPVLLWLVRLRGALCYCCLCVSMMAEEGRSATSRQKESIRATNRKQGLAPTRKSCELPTDKS